MSLSYADIKTAMDAVIKNGPAVKIRGNVHNTNLTNTLQHSRDRLADITVNVSDLADEYMMYYNSSTSTWKFRKVRHAVSFNNSNIVANSFVLDVNHGLDTYTPTIVLTDDNRILQNVFGIVEIVDADNLSIDFGGAISGTWELEIKY